MNQFTKEELEKLIDGICHLISIGSCDNMWNAEMRELKDKLQSMIDSHCEHDNTDDCKCCDSVICDDCGARW